MKHKLLLAALLTVPMCCWAEQPAAPRLTIDLANPSIRQILRDTVATPVRVTDPLDDIGANGVADITANVTADITADVQPIVSLTAPRGPPIPPPVATPQPDEILAEILVEFIDELLDDPVDTAEEQYNEWLSAQSRDNLLTTQQRYEKHQRLFTGTTRLSDPSNYIPNRKP